MRWPSPGRASFAVLRCVDTPKGGREALKEFHGQVEVWRTHPGSRSTGLGRSSSGDTGAIQMRWRVTQASWDSPVSSPHLFLHFCSQQQANLIPGLNLSALGIFSTGLSVLPSPAGPRGAPPAPHYHPFAVSSSAFRGLLMLWVPPGSSETLLRGIGTKALIWRPCS